MHLWRSKEIVLFLIFFLGIGGFAESQDKIHAVNFFGDLSIKSDYITPRGLVVEDQGFATQFISGINFSVYKGEGLIKEFSLSGGAWTNFLSHATGAPNPDGSVTGVTHFNEIDPFLGFELKPGEEWTAGMMYVPFISPPDLFDAEHNMQFSVSFDDSAYLGDYALHPYVKPFWTIDGDSTVVLGDVPALNTEIGIAPALTIGEGSQTPLTLSLPTLVTIHEPDFYGESGPVGVLSIGLKAAMSLATVSDSLAGFNLHAAVEYFHLANDNLPRAAALLGNGNDRDWFVGSIGVNWFLRREC